VGVKNSLPNMIDIIKRAAVDAVNASKPVDIMFGVVAAVSPLSVKIDQRFTLDAGFLIELKPQNTYEAGAKLVLLRMAGGQKFLVLGEVL
jgi:hypothetical protein